MPGLKRLFGGVFMRLNEINPEPGHFLHSIEQNKNKFQTTKVPACDVFMVLE
jgi:hypothetical protein